MTSAERKCELFYVNRAFDLDVPYDNIDDQKSNQDGCRKIDGTNTRKFIVPEIIINDKYRPGEHRRMLKNIVAISIAFMLLFTAFHSTANLQSSLNDDSGLGTISLSALYAALIFSCMFLP